MSEKRPIETATPRSIEEQQLITSKCCFCIPLKIACFILGYLTLLTNLFNTLMVVAAMVVYGMMTEGFKMIRTSVTESGQVVADLDPVQQGYIMDWLIVTGVIMLLNVIWLCWNVYMIVGLHKRRPGPIKLHMTITTTRFILLVLALLICTGPGHDIIISGTEISLTGYFLVVYYAYATRLDRSLKARILAIETTPPPETLITDVYFAYPKILDKQHLVEKEKY